MPQERKPDAKRGEIAFIVAIVIGLVIGILIKKIRIGMIIGLILGTMIVFTGWARTTKK